MQLVIAEKPSVAQAVARVIGAYNKKDGFLEGNGYVVSWCVGHLVELAAPESYSEDWKKWSYGSLPMIPDKWMTEVKGSTAAQFKVLEKLMRDEKVDRVVCATDAGREGELIFRLVYEQAGCKKSIERLWISSMEESAIRSGFANLKPGSAYEHLYESALCRQRADWLIGLNATRLFTVLYGGKLLKVGRVQTPTLAMLVEREAEIGGFRKTPYYVAHIIGGGVEAATERIDDRKRADGIVEKCKGAKATVISVTHEEKTVGTPKLYDLTTLQREANRIFGFTAKQTLEYTQSLYEKRLVTYPRTDSQFLSDDMGETARNVYFLIFESMPHTGTMNGEPEFQTILNSGKVTDHHAIIPTVQIASQDMGAVPDCEKKILSLIATRLLCAAGQKHIYLSTRAEIECGGERFQVSGKTVVDNGFKAYEDALKQFFGIKKDGEEEKKLPEFYEGQVIEVEDARVTEKFTLPPKRFTEDLFSKSEVWIPRRKGAG